MCALCVGLFTHWNCEYFEFSIYKEKSICKYASETVYIFMCPKEKYVSSSQISLWRCERHTKHTESKSQESTCEMFHFYLNSVTFNHGYFRASSRAEISFAQCFRGQFQPSHSILGSYEFSFWLIFDHNYIYLCISWQNTKKGTALTREISLWKWFIIFQCAFSVYLHRNNNLWYYIFRH